MKPHRLLELRNPHAILATLQARPDAVREVRLKARSPEGVWETVAELAGDHRIPISTRGQRTSGRRGTERAGAGMALVAPPEGIDLPQLFSSVDNGGLWLGLDCIQDPHNVGAVFRSASFFGVRGVIVTKDRSAPISDTVCDIAAGGTEFVPFSIVTNLSRAMEQARTAGLWTLGLSEHADDDLHNVDRARPWLVLLGNEQSGLRRLTLKNCDQTCRLTASGSVTSLNVSAAAAASLAVLSRPG